MGTKMLTVCFLEEILSFHYPPNPCLYLERKWRLKWFGPAGE
jgi:hypothetical protein